MVVAGSTITIVWWMRYFGFVSDTHRFLLQTNNSAVFTKIGNIVLFALATYYFKPVSQVAEKEDNEDKQNVEEEQTHM